MNPLFVLTLYLVFNNVSADDNVNQTKVQEEKDDFERIVGGKKAENGSIPYQVSLRVRGHWHFCGGSIVTPSIILTAAHCVTWATTDLIQAVVGTNQLNSGGVRYQIRKIVYHEKYDPYEIVNDIALLFTDKEMIFGEAVDGVELNDEPIEKGAALVLSGWGRTSYPGKIPNDLYVIDLKAISYEECKKAHQNINAVYETQICSLTKYGEGACHGDSGGPLVHEGRQVGVVSWGIPCARGKPDVFTKVEAYRDWIEKTLYDDDMDHVKKIKNKKNNRSSVS